MSKFENDPNVAILDNEYFEPCYSLDDSCGVTKKSIINHKHELSWMSGPIVAILKIYMIMKQYILLIILFILLFILYKY